ncbi:MAG TPA: carbohydrate-binding family 9-like protein, partial [Urbifossiella sp.]
MIARIAMSALLALLAALPASVAEAPPERQSWPHPKGYVCYRVRSPITIDGKAEAAWADAPWSDSFVDIEGGEKPAPRFKTRMKMLWDDDALYILAELEEPDLWATLEKHDTVIFHDHDFEVFLDPDGDNHNYGE